MLLWPIARMMPTITSPLTPLDPSNKLDCFARLISIAHSRSKQAAQSLPSELSHATRLKKRLNAVYKKSFEVLVSRWSAKPQ